MKSVTLCKSKLEMYTSDENTNITYSLKDKRGQEAPDQAI